MACPATWCLILLLLVLQLVMQFALSPVESHRAYLIFGLSRQDFHAWQPLSCIWLHGGWGHLITNACLLLWAGGRVERIRGWRAMLLVWMVGGLAGGAVHLMFSPRILVGASAGIFALLIHWTTLAPDARLRIPLRVSAAHLGSGMILSSLLLMLIAPDAGLPLLSSVGEMMADHRMESVFQIAHAAHLGGALAGMLLARRLLRPRVTLETLRAERARREG
ncbi:MAG TPA: rhomboid family intramembrane serine protease [Luteolibacter sp.]|nr:rhomboid family intramembrane serine protease [Luteolibacter sp.]